MRHPGHFGGNSAEGFAFPIRIVGSSLDVARIRVAEGILPHSDGPVRGHPEGIAEPRIAMLREPTQSTKLSRLLRTEIKPTELEELYAGRADYPFPTIAFSTV